LGHGKLIRTAWKRVSPLAKYAAKLSGPRLRNLFSKVKCFITGHPVDVATGRVFTEAIDFSLPGPLPLVFERSYFSSWSHRDGVLGPGWSHSLDQALWFEEGIAVYRNAEGQEIVFDLVDTKGEAELEREFFESVSRNTLVRERSGWRVITPEGLIHHFAQVEGGSVLRIVRSTTRHPDVAITYAYDREARLREVSTAPVGWCASSTTGMAAWSRIFFRIQGPRPPRSFTPNSNTPTRACSSPPATPTAGPTTYDYDGRLMVSETNRNGVTFYWLYDGRGSSARCLRTWGVDGEQIIYNQKLDYDPRNGVTLVTDSYNNKTLYKKNAVGAVSRGHRRPRRHDGARVRRRPAVVSETDPAWPTDQARLRPARPAHHDHLPRRQPDRAQVRPAPARAAEAVPDRGGRRLALPVRRPRPAHGGPRPRGRRLPHPRVGGRPAQGRGRGQRRPHRGRPSATAGATRSCSGCRTARPSAASTTPAAAWWRWSTPTAAARSGTMTCSTA
jgi:hypothetical protein